MTVGGPSWRTSLSNISVDGAARNDASYTHKIDPYINQLSRYIHDNGVLFADGSKAKKIFDYHWKLDEEGKIQISHNGQEWVVLTGDTPDKNRELYNIYQGIWQASNHVATNNYYAPTANTLAPPPPNLAPQTPLALEEAQTKIALLEEALRDTQTELAAIKASLQAEGPLKQRIRTLERERATFEAENLAVMTSVKDAILFLRRDLDESALPHYDPATVDTLSKAREALLTHLAAIKKEPSHVREVEQLHALLLEVNALNRSLVLSEHEAKNRLHFLEKKISQAQKNPEIDPEIVQKLSLQLARLKEATSQKSVGITNQLWHSIVKVLDPGEHQEIQDNLEAVASNIAALRVLLKMEREEKREIQEDADKQVAGAREGLLAAQGYQEAAERQLERVQSGAHDLEQEVARLQRTYENERAAAKRRKAELDSVKGEKRDALLRSQELERQLEHTKAQLTALQRIHLTRAH